MFLLSFSSVPKAIAHCPPGHDQVKFKMCNVYTRCPVDSQCINGACCRMSIPTPPGKLRLSNEPPHRNQQSGFPTRSNINQVGKPQKKARGLKFLIKKKRDYTMLVAKTKTLISCAVTTQLIGCTFAFAYAIFWFTIAAA